MNLYRVSVNDDFFLLVRAPSEKLLQLCIDQVTDEGYILDQILTILHPSGLRNVKIVSLGEIGPNETIIDWSVLKTGL